MGLSDWPDCDSPNFGDEEPEIRQCDYDGYVVAETRKAVAIGLREDTVEHWLPLSQLESIEYEEDGDTEEIFVGEKILSVTIPAWLADAKGL